MIPPPNPNNDIYCTICLNHPLKILLEYTTTKNSLRFLLNSFNRMNI